MTFASYLMLRQTIIKLLVCIPCTFLVAQTSFADVFCRFQANEEVHYGRVAGSTIHVLSGAPWLGGQETGESTALEDAVLLPPSEPRNIIGIAGAYASPDSNPPLTSRWFAKSASGAATNGDKVIIPASLDALKVEVELVIVIGKLVKNASPDEAAASIFGYATGTEIFGFVESYHRVAGEDRGRMESLLAPALKLGDNYAPFGPFIYSDVDWRNRKRTLSISTPSGKVRESYEHNTSGLLYPPRKIVSDLSRVLTLEPGDLIFSGTSKAFIVKAGETVTTEVEGFGILKNVIVSSTDNLQDQS
jgi:2-keto-4-pentenoate hydratase/2-oxohepta-3-ene-1,7-dioic acid hydratase in catechol pathway